MTMVDVPCQQTHGKNLKEEVASRNVQQAEQKEPEGAEVKRQQTIPCNDGTRLAKELLTYLVGHVVRAAKLLAQFGQKVLELRCDLFLLLGIVDIRLLEIALHLRR